VNPPGSPPGLTAGAAPDRGRRVRRPSGDDRERAILATAERLLTDRPLADVSVDDLARGAGLSRPTFYFYFESKEAVVLALLDRVASEARALRGRALQDAGEDPATIWRRGVASIVDTFRSHRALMLAVGQLAAESEEVRRVWGDIIEGFVEDTVLAIESERRRGAALPGPDARLLAVALNWMNERVLHAAMSGQHPSMDENEALDVLLTVWSRAVYGDDNLGSGR
jgi:AcrR family transcriptional regulator